MNGGLSLTQTRPYNISSAVRKYIMQEGSSVPTIDWWVVPVQLVIL